MTYNRLPIPRTASVMKALLIHPTPASCDTHIPAILFDTRIANRVTMTDHAS